ncbi:MAG: FG-GAP-like repeat-containing protein [Planctomycetaceae bacterium]
MSPQLVAAVTPNPIQQIISAFDSDLIVLAAEGGTGFFSAGQTFTGTSGDRTYSPTLGDIDGDGDLDLVFGNRDSAGQVWTNNGDGTFTNTGQSLPDGIGHELGD